VETPTVYLFEGPLTQTMLERGKRYVRLVGDVAAVEEIGADLGPTGIAFLRDKDAVYVHHQEFDASTDIEKSAGNLLSIVRGLYRLATGRPLNIDTQESVVVDEKGHRTAYLVRTAQVRITASAHIVVTDKAGKTLREVKPTDPIPSWAKGVLASEEKRRALALYESQGDTWAGLYKVLEVIEASVGEVTGLGTTTKAQVGRFTQTANSYRAIGPDARHAKDKIPAPSNPMPLAEARSIIEGLLIKWLA
jgi:hypothetical protein